MSRLIVTFIALTLLLTWTPLYAQDQSTPVPPSNDYLRSLRFGINHISGAEQAHPPERYARALELGAGWNRWPLYWNWVEAEPGEWDWADYDRLVEDDTAQGLQINAVLLGRPEWAADGNRLVGMHQPIFEDGSDTPSPGKAINPENPWANFVYQAVLRYQPGGELAEEHGWEADRGIRVWEVWNEPDFNLFWSGSIGDYARLLKISYLVIKLADPEAQVMFGGLLYNSNDNWLARVLAIFLEDPMSAEYGYFFDIVAVHSYSYAWRSSWLVLVAQQTLIAYDLEKPIWLNESGVPIWDDYPGPSWVTEPKDKQLRATQEQQAYFFVQSTAYALAQGAEVIFYHQLYDDCGNQPGGTNFPPHDGELCVPGETCFGDAFGLYRNGADAVCFREHPQPNTARPAAEAYALMTRLFGQDEWDKATIDEVNNRAVVITFDRPATDERVYVIWNRTIRPMQAIIPTDSPNGLLYSLAGSEWIRPNESGKYVLDLPAATCDYFPFLREQDVTAIGGEPYILITALPDAPVTITVNDAPGIDPNLPRRCVIPGQPPRPRPTATPSGEAPAPEPTPGS